MVRGSLGRSIEFSKESELNEEYPMYAMPIKEFLKLDKWIPHQDALAQGLLVEVKKGDTDAEVLFCSHQWVSFDHPDPAGEQLRALQSVIRMLMKGKTDVVSNSMLDAIYQYKMLAPGSEWAKKLPHMLVWFDYLSIPQPGALVTQASSELVNELDTNQNGVVEMEELLNADLTKKTSRRQSTDHRQLAEGESVDERIAALVGQLKAAVDSIPSYIERASMMWVLVPPVKHHSLHEQICDFASWRRRGWCRMEVRAPRRARTAAAAARARARARTHASSHPSPAARALARPCGRSSPRASSRAATTCR